MMRNDVAEHEHQAKRRCIKFPQHAWLAPLAGFLFGWGMEFVRLSILNTSEQELDPTPGVWSEIIFPLVFFGAFVYGMFKSIQCLVLKQHLKHGIAGVSVLGTFILLLFLAAVFLFGSGDQNTVNAERQIDEMTASEFVAMVCNNTRPDLPMEIAPDLYMDGVYIDPPDRLNVQMLIMADNIDPDLLRADVQQMPQDLKDDPLYAELARRGGKVRYIWRDVNGNVLLDIEYSPDDFK